MHEYLGHNLIIQFPDNIFMKRYYTCVNCKINVYCHSINEIYYLLDNFNNYSNGYLHLIELTCDEQQIKNLIE